MFVLGGDVAQVNWYDNRFTRHGALVELSKLADHSSGGTFFEKLDAALGRYLVEHDIVYSL